MAAVNDSAYPPEGQPALEAIQLACRILEGDLQIAIQDALPRDCTDRRTRDAMVRRLDQLAEQLERATARLRAACRHGYPTPYAG